METNISNMIKENDGTVIIYHALQSKWYGTQWKLSGVTYDGLEWLDKNEISKPTEDEIDAEIIRLQAEYDALAWKRSREENYPTIAELTVALYDTDDKSAVEAKRAAVKKKYPKP